MEPVQYIGYAYGPMIRIQTYTEPVPLKYRKPDTKYPWIYTDIFTVYTHQSTRRILLEDLNSPMQCVQGNP